ncbi:hypothetical protein JAAARDRAFT_308207 [Jaapia argillacea MUCL 33604]|uniref:CoA-transferase family III n=1 Tax=Jaapia argillacea MUCL 33604 TaxID=933084 RepID=A0A067Q141_9AGAM|nr:hypothetical protein JAAARDRAFT_308207 [Jaapia argillacea MUCL 33604]
MDMEATTCSLSPRLLPAPNVLSLELECDAEMDIVQEMVMWGKSNDHPSDALSQPIADIETLTTESFQTVMIKDPISFMNVDSFPVADPSPELTSPAVSLTANDLDQDTTTTTHRLVVEIFDVDAKSRVDFDCEFGGFDSPMIDTGVELLDVSSCTTPIDSGYNTSDECGFTSQHHGEESYDGDEEMVSIETLDTTPSIPSPAVEDETILVEPTTPGNVDSPIPTPTPTNDFDATATTTSDPSTPSFIDTPIPIEAKTILTNLFHEIDDIPQAVKDIASETTFEGTAYPVIPLPHKHFAITSALQALHGAFASHIYHLRTRTQSTTHVTHSQSTQCNDDNEITQEDEGVCHMNDECIRPPMVKVNTDHAGLSLTGLMMVQIDGKPFLQKLDRIPKMAAEDPLWYLPAKSVVSTIYECAPSNSPSSSSTSPPQKTYFHAHGSLHPSHTLDLMNIPSSTYNDASLSKAAARKLVQDFVGRKSAEEMMRWSIENGLPGDVCYTPEEFDKTEHGRIASTWPLITPQTRLEDVTPPIPFTMSPSIKRPLEGIKVLEMTRVIAGPAIGRQLAELGAQVVRFISPNLPDYGFYFQPDFNLGKRAVHIDLRTERGKVQLHHLLQDADVFLHGYRPGVMERLGFGREVLNSIAVKRGKGFVHVSENAYGHEGPWAWRPGFQQIADVVSGVAWETGQACGRAEPIVPCWPITDYNTGVMGSIAVLQGLLKRSELGGSWHAPVSLLQYALFARRQGRYSTDYIQSLYESGPRHSMEDSMFTMSSTQMQHIVNSRPELISSTFLEESGSSYGRITHLKAVAQLHLRDTVTGDGKPEEAPTCVIPSGFGYSPYWGENRVGWDEEDADCVDAKLIAAGLQEPACRLPPQLLEEVAQGEVEMTDVKPVFEQRRPESVPLSALSSRSMKVLRDLRRRSLSLGALEPLKVLLQGLGRAPKDIRSLVPQSPRD